MSQLTPAVVYQARSDLKTIIRSFFKDRGYTEIDTPLVVPQPGTEVHLDYFETSWLDFQGNLHLRYLRSSPELHLKQALSHGMERVYNLGKCFRNGGEASAWHNPEFTMLEWYESHITYEAFMEQTDTLVRYCWEGMMEKGYRTAPLPSATTRLSVADAFSSIVGIKLEDRDPKLSQKAADAGYLSVRSTDDFETAFFKLLLDVVEPELKKMAAVFLYDYPPSQAALAKVDGLVAKRFELYLDGVELCNGFSELLDPEENRNRLETAQEARRSLMKPVPPVDSHFLEALTAGLPPCCGNALGFDRLLAIILNCQDMRDIIPFHQNQIYPLED